MIEGIIIFDAILVVVLLILVLVLVGRNKRTKKQPDSVEELERRLNEVISDNQECEEKAFDYVASSQNRKYHKIDCKFVELINEKEYGSLEDFKKKKYVPCKVCLKK